MLSNISLNVQIIVNYLALSLNLNLLINVCRSLDMCDNLIIPVWILTNNILYEGYLYVFS